MYPCKILRVRSVSKQGNNNAVVAAGGEMHLDGTLLDAALQEGEAAGIVVCGNYDKGVAVLFRPFQDGPYHLVKVEKLFAHVTNLVAVAPVVDLGPLNHEEETFLVVPSPDGSAVIPFGPDVPRSFMDANTLVSIQRGDEQIFRIDPALGGVVGVELLKYSKEKTKTPEEAVHVNLGNFDYPFMALNARTMAALGLGATKTETDVVKGDGFVEISRVNAAGDLKVTERWSIESERSYEIDYTVSVTNLGNASREISNLMIDGGVLPHSVSGRKEDGGGAAYMPLDKNHATVVDPKTLAKLSDNYAIAQSPNSLEGDKQKPRGPLKDLHR